MFNLFAPANGPDLLRNWTKLTDEAALAEYIGRYSECAKKLDSSLRVAQKLGPYCPLLGRTLTNLARFYMDQGDFKRAHRYYQRALPLQELNLYCDSIQLAETLAEMSALYFATGKNLQAQPLYDRSIAILKKQQPTLETVQSLQHIGEVFSAIGSYREAKAMYLSGLIVARLLRDDAHITQISNLLNYVCARIQHNRYGKAQLATNFCAAPVSVPLANRIQTDQPCDISTTAKFFQILDAACD